ncbi:hypothetical protein C5471_13600 [Photorhabdus tasmaniensis]|uniref:tRNA-uridine aminocarboxypropyltransferase n=1 Tax=Photorhabdus tasmaniensis TaxID=1004159 RepID=A0ABX0GKK3_9GAMM|nr:hypothetical protein [Photorhabdus tasmaniensis]
MDDIPLLSVNSAAKTDYSLRVSAREEQHCTAEVAATILEQAGDLIASQRLLTHFSYFHQQYLAGKPHHPIA